MVLLFAGGALAPTHAQSVTITAPTAGSTVTVGSGSQYLPVKVDFPNLYSPTSCVLFYEDEVGGIVNYASSESFYFESPTGKWVFNVTVPTGTQSGLTIRARGYRSPDSSGFPGGFANGTVDGVTVTKEP